MKRLYSALGLCPLLLVLVLLKTSNVNAQVTEHAIQFDGTTGFTETELQTGFSTANFCIEFWFSPSSLNKLQYLADFHSLDGGGSCLKRVVLYLDASNKITLQCNPDPEADNPLTLSSGVTVSQGTWYHVSANYSSGSWKLIINGSLVANAMMPNGINYNFTGNDYLLLGTDFQTISFFANVKMDEVRIWTKARTAAEVTADYRTKLTGNESNLYLYYNMDVIEGGNIYDSSPNLRNATIYPSVSGINESPMPVELSSFTASNIKSGVDLKWKTATEINNYGFEIERKDENGSWEKIGFVKGNGNSNSQKEYSFVDDKAPAGKIQYRIKQLDLNGQFKYYDAITVSVDVPKEYKLLQNSPNPFNPTTAIKFQLPVSSFVTVKIYDQIGREVTTLVNEEKPSGSHIVYWNGKDKNGNSVASGIYLYRLSAGNYVETRKMNLLK
ncbi:MAG: LamG-like jellyroll fold domain-containing protein [Bacteroidota bacterium]|nr:LamG-like jellyroll fold domain-containing protein [Bacteroidota bacterium]